MYASTPQHIIDEESHPGVLADMMNSSSSSDSSSSSSSSDSDSSTGSQHTTAKRIKRAFRHRKRRKSVASSKDTPNAPSVLSSPSIEQPNNYFESQKNSAPDNEGVVLGNPLSRRGSVLNTVMSGDETSKLVHRFRLLASARSASPSTPKSTASMAARTSTRRTKFLSRQCPMLSRTLPEWPSSTTFSSTRSQDAHIDQVSRPCYLPMSSTTRRTRHRLQVPDPPTSASLDPKLCAELRLCLTA
jgi:hypothetical protein